MKKNIKFLFFFVATFLSMATMNAQTTKTVTGTVAMIITNGNGPGPSQKTSGVKVCVVGVANKCTETDKDGKYTIEVPITAKELIFSLTPDESNPNPTATETIPANNKVDATIHWTVGA
jgi:hypothetical protein